MGLKMKWNGELIDADEFKNTIVSRIRSDFRGWLKQLRANASEDEEINMYPVREWFGFKYIVTGKMDLITGRQNLEVVDITENFEEIALFAKSRPEQTKREFAIVFHTEIDEGSETTVLREDGGHRHVRFADLPVSVVRGTQQDYRDLKDDQMDMLEQSVDAGGKIGF